MAEQTRDYDAELTNSSDSQYAYNFDFDVIHPLMIELSTLFSISNALSWGAITALTARLKNCFDDIT